METYKDFVNKYGNRPPDIVFAVTQLDTLKVVIKDLETIMKEAPDLRSLEKMIADYITKVPDELKEV